jgi:hypothetical protein
MMCRSLLKRVPSLLCSIALLVLEIFFEILKSFSHLSVLLNLLLVIICFKLFTQIPTIISHVVGCIIGIVDFKEPLFRT